MNSIKPQDFAQSPTSSDDRLASLEAGFEQLKSDFTTKASEKAGAVSEAAQDLYATAENYIKSNPIPVAIGIAAAAALVAIMLSNRNRGGRAVDRKWSKDLSRVSDDVAQTVRSELRRLNLDDRFSAIASAIPDTEIKRVVGPFIQQIVDGFARAKETITKSA